MFRSQAFCSIIYYCSTLIGYIIRLEIRKSYASRCIVPLMTKAGPAEPKGRNFASESRQRPKLISWNIKTSYL